VDSDCIHQHILIASLVQRLPIIKLMHRSHDDHAANDNWVEVSNGSQRKDKKFYSDSPATRSVVVIH